MPFGPAQVLQLPRWRYITNDVTTEKILVRNRMWPPPYGPVYGVQLTDARWLSLNLTSIGELFDVQRPDSGLFGYDKGNFTDSTNFLSCYNLGRTEQIKRYVFRNPKSVRDELGMNFTFIKTHATVYALCRISTTRKNTLNWIMSGPNIIGWWRSRNMHTSCILINSVRISEYLDKPSLVQEWFLPED